MVEMRMDWGTERITFKSFKMYDPGLLLDYLEGKYGNMTYKNFMYNNPNTSMIGVRCFKFLHIIYPNFEFYTYVNFYHSKVDFKIINNLDTKYDTILSIDTSEKVPKVFDKIVTYLKSCVKE